MQQDALWRLASPSRQKRAASYPRREDAIHCLVAEAMLRYAFPGRDPETLDREPDGKPFWEGAHFNLSHSGPWVVLAVGDGPVGVDVEAFRPGRNVTGLANRHFTPEEQAFVNQDEERFLRVWTAKESRLKRTGLGLRTALDSFSVLDDPQYKTWPLPGGVLTLCADSHPEGPEWICVNDLLQNVP